MKHYVFRLFLVALLAVPLAACPGTIDTARKGLAVAELSATAAATTAYDLREQGVIVRDSDTDQNIKKGLISADGALDAAQASVRLEDSEGANKWLAIAKEAIAQIENVLTRIKTGGGS